MKEVITTIASIYLFFNLGLGMNQHYCMGFLKEVTFGHEAHTCCCGESDMMEGCCEDIHISLSIEDDQIQNAELNISPIWDLAQLSLPVLDIEKEAVVNSLAEFLIEPPPKKSNSRIFLHSLVFYA